MVSGLTAVEAQLLVEPALSFLGGQPSPVHLHGLLQSRSSSGDPGGTWAALGYGQGVRELAGGGVNCSAAGGRLLSLSLS